jgi:hypothetical protein
VRVKVKCCDPTQINGLVEVFFNKLGYDLKFVAEGPRARSSSMAGSSEIGKLEGKDHNRDRNFPDRNDEKRGGN